MFRSGTYSKRRGSLRRTELPVSFSGVVVMGAVMILPTTRDGSDAACIMSMTVQELSKDDAVAIRMEDGRAAAFLTIAKGKEFHPHEERITLKHTKTGYEAYDHDTWMTYVFDMCEGNGRSFRMTKAVNPNGLGTTISFSNGKLLEMTD